jgi:uncharacterized protein involved in exopolysaccharide biosynthesis
MSDPQPLFPIADEDEAYGLTTRDLLNQWFKHWVTVVLCFLVITALTWGALLLQPSIYEASAKVWVQTEQQGTPSFLSGIAAYRESQVPEPVNRKIETEIQLLLSRSNAEAVVSKLHITKSQLVQTAADYLHDDLPSWLRFDKPKSAAETNDEIVELFMKGVAVEPTRSKTADTTSNVLETHFECADKSLAPRALAALLQEYIQFGAQHNRELGETTYKLVESKIGEETGELNQLDDQILALTVEQASRAEVASSDNAAVTRSARSAGLDATLSSSRAGSGASGLGLLKSQTIDMQARLEEAQQLYTEQSPNVRHLAQQLSALRERLNAGVRASAALDARLDRLERQRGIAVERYTGLRQKLDQIQLYLQLNPVESDSRLITETPLEPHKPKIKTKVLIGLLGPIAGLLLGLILAGLREYFDHRLQNPQDVQRFLGLDTLAILPKVSS